MSVIKVVLAIIEDTNQRILITKRAMNIAHPGVWEFPGGKVEPGEDPVSALHRELQEELGITIHNPVFLQEIRHDYADKTVHLLVYRVRHYTGQPTCLENQQDLRFVLPDALVELDFPEANAAIISLIIPSTSSLA